MFWYILIAVILITLTWILLGPVIIFLDTEAKRYTLSLPGIFKASVIPTPEFFLVRGSVFFIPYRFNPMGIKRNKTGEGRKSRPGKKRPFNISQGRNLLKGLISSLRIRKLHLNIDTDDYTLNAQLIPVFSAVNTENIRLQANFGGDSYLLLDLRTRLGEILWTLLKIKYKSMLNQ